MALARSTPYPSRSDSATPVVLPLPTDDADAYLEKNTVLKLKDSVGFDVYQADRVYIAYWAQEEGGKSSYGVARSEKVAEGAGAPG
uniref:Uncharacterized protein n=1 Tax=Oryza punctata TaxID=4537 RepID=A0A0E0JJK5_ORYPU